jgi:uncharacterized protein DUF4396
MRCHSRQTSSGRGGRLSWRPRANVVQQDHERTDDQDHGSRCTCSKARLESPIPVDEANGQAQSLASGQSLNRVALSATVHCLTGCAIGEVLGMILSTWWGWGSLASIVLAVVLAFFFGYSLTSLPLLRSGMSVRQVAPVAFASDTASIATMEVIDNLFILIVPGAISAGLGDPLFWWSLAVGLLIAGVVAYPVNRSLVARGRGHAVVHAHHAQSGG